MKIFLSLLLICLVPVISLFAQTGSINNTLGTGGSFIVKDGTDNFMRVDQLTGNAIILRNLELGGTATSTSTVGLITKNGLPFLNNYGIENTFLGISSGNFTMTGSKNTVVGFEALKTNTTGSENTAVGLNTLNLNTSGSYNTAVGNLTLNNNTTGNANTACGIGSLFSNTVGSNNSAFGNVTLYSNTTGENNSVFGTFSLYSNNNGSNNNSFGVQSLYSNVSGSDNSAFGNNSLYYNTIGQKNTAIGHNAGYNITTGSNNVAVGYFAPVPDGTASNQVRIGNNSISYAGIQVAWSITSDRRWKENINPSDLGLDFISKLNPVLYTRINDENQKIEYGLIAQELEEALKEEGVINSAMLTIDGDGRYELRYNDLLAPMIKAIQELKNENDQLRSEVESLKSVKEQLAEIESLKEELVNEIKLIKAASESANVKFSSIED